MHSVKYSVELKQWHSLIPPCRFTTVLSTQPRRTNRRTDETRIQQLTHTHFTLGHTERGSQKKNQEKKRKKNTTTEPVNEYIYISVINQLFLFGKSNQHTPRAHAYSYIMRRFLIVIHNLDFHNYRPLHQQSNGSD